MFLIIYRIKVLSLRGKNTLVVCESCGRKTPRNKAVAYEKALSIGTGMNTTKDVRLFEKRKIYYCVSCAKHRGIFERKKREAIARAERSF
jgi:ribosomal protein S26